MTALHKACAWLAAKAKAVYDWLYDYLIKPTPPVERTGDVNDGGA
jgi:hypothetical protein